MSTIFPSHCELIVVGIVGGIASGKSLVADMLAEFGAHVLDADRLGHEALEQPEIKAAIREHWGEKVFDRMGAVNRKQLGQFVFGEHPQAAEQLAILESISHPFINRRIREELKRHREQNSNVVVLDAPILMKAGWDHFCDEIIFVECDEEIRLHRSLARGWHATELKEREKSQVPLDEKRKRSTIQIQNQDDLEFLKLQLAQVWEGWSQTEFKSANEYPR